MTSRVLAIVRRHAVTTVEVIVALALAFAIGRITASDDSPVTPGAVDIGFSQDMAVHHEQALSMAGLAQTRGSAAVRAIANAILVNQSEEVGLLRGWLKLWREPAEDAAPMSWMPADEMAGMSAHASGSMPGMASTRELHALWGRSGRPFDVLFLQLMIRHHEGGIEMARYAVLNARLGTVRDAARAMAVAQIEDLGQMRALLKADDASPLPAP